MEPLSLIVSDSPNGILYYNLRNSGGKEWLIPETNSIRTAFQIYQPTARNGKIVKQVFPFSFIRHSDLVCKIIGVKKRKIELYSDLKQYIDELFTDSYEISFFGGTPGVHQKVVAQIFKKKKIVAYCKVTTNKDIGYLFDKECDVLEYLKSRGVKDVPLVLGRKRIGEFEVFLQSSVKQGKSYSPIQLNKVHMAFLENLYQKTLVKMKFRDTDYYRMIVNLQSRMEMLEPEERRIVQSAIESVLSNQKNADVEYGFYHGDFTPWNVAVENGQLKAFDFEYSQKSYPPYLDVFHFFMQVELFVGHKSYIQIIRDFELLKQQLNAMGFVWNYGNMFQLYLLEIINLYLSRGQCETSEVAMHLKERIRVLDAIQKQGNHFICEKS